MSETLQLNGLFLGNQWWTCSHQIVLDFSKSVDMRILSSILSSSLIHCIFVRFRFFPHFKPLMTWYIEFVKIRRFFYQNKFFIDKRPSTYKNDRKVNLEHVGKSRMNFHIRSQYVCMYIVYILLDVNDVEHAPKGNIWSHFHELVSYGTCQQLHAITENHYLAQKRLLWAYSVWAWLTIRNHLIQPHSKLQHNLWLSK